jgi:hypothetical protein
VLLLSYALFDSVAMAPDAGWRRRAVAHDPAALLSDRAACSAWSPHTTTVKRDASPSLRPETATRNVAACDPAVSVAYLGVLMRCRQSSRLKTA